MAKEPSTAYTVTSDPGWSLHDALVAMKQFRNLPPIPRPPRLVESPYISKHPQQWFFPVDRFVEYGEEDKAWAIPLGCGSWGDDTGSLVAYQVDFSGFDLLRQGKADPLLFAHPEVAERIRRAIDDQIARLVFDEDQHGDF